MKIPDIAGNAADRGSDALVVHGASKSFMRDGRTVLAVGDACLTACVGECVGIVGRSGGGKSTLAHMIAGLMKPTSGTVSFGGFLMSAMGQRALAEFRRSRIGFVPQVSRAMPYLSVYDNVRLPFYLGEPAIRPAAGAIRDASREAISVLGLEGLESAYPASLSGGELRRVCVARAIAGKPSVLIADEPTGDLDLESTRLVLGVFRDLARSGSIVIFVTHDPEAERQADRVYSMNAGLLTAVR